MYPEPNQPQPSSPDAHFDHVDAHAVLAQLFDGAGPFTRRPREDEPPPSVHRQGLRL